MRCALSPGRVQRMHRHGLGAGRWKDQPAYGAAQFPRSVGHPGGPGLPVQSRDRHGFGPDRRDHRSAHSGHTVSPFSGPRRTEDQHGPFDRPRVERYARRTGKGTQHQTAAGFRPASRPPRRTGAAVLPWRRAIWACGPFSPKALPASTLGTWPISVSWP